MNMSDELGVFYNIEKNKMDNNFKNDWSKFYNYLLEKIIKNNKVNFNDLMLEKIELFKYKNGCLYKPKPYDISGNDLITRKKKITNRINLE